MHMVHLIWVAWAIKQVRRKIRSKKYKNPVCKSDGIFLPGLTKGRPGQKICNINIVHF